MKFTDFQDVLVIFRAVIMSSFEISTSDVSLPLYSNRDKFFDVDFGD